MVILQLETLHLTRCLDLSRSVTVQLLEVFLIAVLIPYSSLKLVFSTRAAGRRHPDDAAITPGGQVVRLCP